MKTKTVIYMPSIIDGNTQARLRAAYPNALFVSRWQDGATLWQDALAKLEAA